MLVQRLRARESQALRQQLSHFDPSDRQVTDQAPEIDAVEFPEPVTTDGQTFDRF